MKVLKEDFYKIDGEEFDDYGTKDITKWSYPDLPYSSEIFDKSTLGGFSAYREYLNDPKYISYITPNEYFEQVAKGRRQTVGQVIRNVEADPEILEHLRNVLLKVLKIECQTLFGFIPDDLSFEFQPLLIQTETEIQEGKDKEFARIKLMYDSKLLTKKEFFDALKQNDIFIQKTIASELEEYTENPELSTRDFDRLDL